MENLLLYILLTGVMLLGLWTIKTKRFYNVWRTLEGRGAQIAGVLSTIMGLELILWTWMDFSQNKILMLPIFLTLGLFVISLDDPLNLNRLKKKKLLGKISDSLFILIGIVLIIVSILWYLGFIKS